MSDTIDKTKLFEWLARMSLMYLEYGYDAVTEQIQSDAFDVPEMRGFTAEEAKLHEEGLNKLYQPTGRNF